MMNYYLLMLKMLSDLNLNSNWDFLLSLGLSVEAGCLLLSSNVSLCCLSRIFQATDCLSFGFVVTSALSCFSSLTIIISALPCSMIFSSHFSEQSANFPTILRNHLDSLPQQYHWFLAPVNYPNPPKFQARYLHHWYLCHQ